MVIPIINSVVFGLVKEDGESYYVLCVINSQRHHGRWSSPISKRHWSVVVGWAKEDGEGREKLDLGS